METSKKTPIEEQRKQALEHYEEAAGCARYFSSFVRDAILAYNPVTEDKKAPVDAEEFFEQRAKGDFSVIKIMQEYASQERNGAIQECIDLMSKEVSFGYIEYQWHALKERLENLKK